MANITIGIDPGKSGAIAVYIDGLVVEARAFGGSDSIANTVREVVQDHSDGSPLQAYIERVHAFPGQGVSSSFAFGKAYGEAIGALDVLDVPYHFITPHTWQRTIAGLPKKKDGASAHKRALKVVAQQRFPAAKPTLKTCDAMLIAEFGARMQSI